MKALIGWCVDHARTVLLLLGLMLIAGAIAYDRIAREAAPEIDIPIFFVTVTYPGISGEEAERLMLRPMERELQGLDGLDTMQSWAGEGFAMLRLDFQAGWNNRDALSDVREEVDNVRPDLPAEAQEPVVQEVDLSLFPVLTSTLSGPVSERALVQLARELRDRIEAKPGVLEVNIGGDREEQLEVLVDPLVLESYQLSLDEISSAISRNNRLIAAGAVDTGIGRIPLRVSGTLEDVPDVLDTAVRVRDDTVVRIRDVAEVRQSYRDPESFTRIDGQPSVSLEIRKRAGANILDVVQRSRAIIEDAREGFPEAVEVHYLQDMAEDVAELLGDLENNVITAVLIVALVILAVMGLRAAVLVGIAIPGAFLAGILSIHLLGETLNIVVLFSLILVVGMLVDGAVVVVELADRLVAEGRSRHDAFRDAARRMAWPITAAVATTLAVFFPILFWPGLIGEFIFLLPATVIITLTASLLMALVFVPVLGSVFGQRRAAFPEQGRQARAANEGRFEELHGITRRYVTLLRPMVAHPGWTLAFTATVMLLAYSLYAAHGRGVSFFPDIEPEFAQIQVQARGDLSVHEADALMRRVEERVRDVPEITTIYTRTIGTQFGRLQGNHAEDVIGIVQLELTDWRARDPATEVLARLRKRVADIPGMVTQVRAQERGPGEERPIRIELRGDDRQQLTRAVEQVRAGMHSVGGFTDVEDDLPLPGVELEVHFDREEAARFGVDVPMIGQGVQLLTDGALLGTYRPEHSDEEVDIRLRLPSGQRHLQQLANLGLSTPQGIVPLANFAELVPVPATGLIKRIDGRRAHAVTADVQAGELVTERLARLEQVLAEEELPPGVNLRVRGEAEEQAEAADFLLLAFALSIFLMFLMLVTQFNRIRQALLVMSAIIFSTAGVLLALLVRGEPFGIVMSGIGVLAVAGIVVNNNIVLIDSYNEKLRDGLAPAEAALRASALRMRPVLLTAVTTILGLMPMVLAWTVDFVGRDFHVGAPSTDYWVQLATAVAGGLLFATPLTLLFTPAMLAWMDGRRRDSSGT